MWVWLLMAAALFVYFICYPILSKLWTSYQNQLNECEVSHRVYDAKMAYYKEADKPKYYKEKLRVGVIYIMGIAVPLLVLLVIRWVNIGYIG